MLKEGSIVRVISATSNGFGGNREYYPIGTICEVQKECGNIPQKVGECLNVSCFNACQIAIVLPHHH